MFQQQKSIQVKFCFYLDCLIFLFSYQAPSRPSSRGRILSLYLHITAAVLNPEVRAASAWRWPQEITSACRKRLDIFILYLLGYIWDLRWSPRDLWCRQNFRRVVERFYTRLWYTPSQLSYRFRTFFFFHEVGFFFMVRVYTGYIRY